MSILTVPIKLRNNGLLSLTVVAKLRIPKRRTKNKKHHIDPWHAIKNVTKKLYASSKKKGCEKLSQWVPSITNRFWWSIETCEGDADILKEKWLSITSHVVNSHEFPNNKVLRSVSMGSLMAVPGARSGLHPALHHTVLY